MPDQHHPLSHHQNDPEKLAKLTKVNTSHMSLLAYYLEKLQSTPDGASNLLDQLTLIYGSGMSNSNLHVPHKLPVLLLGGGAGRPRGGRHVRPADETPLTNLYLTVLNQLGVPVEQIGGSNGQMRELSEVSSRPVGPSAARPRGGLTRYYRGSNTTVMVLLRTECGAS